MRQAHLRLLAVASLAVASVLARATPARAEADTFTLGSGKDGALVVSSAAGQVVNSYATLTAPIAAGATTATTGAVTGAAAAFTSGQVVLVLQTRGGLAAPLVSGSATPVTIAANAKTGRYELARIASVAGATLTFTHALVNAFDANDTQVVSVPEYTTVTINAGAKLTAQPWDGDAGNGGVLAVLATGAVANAGTIDVTGLGFSGGSRVSVLVGESMCAALDGTPGLGGAGAGGAHKGEGLDPTGFGTELAYLGGTAHHFGRGNVGNAGGGGDCFNAGGGGGGNGAAGGGGGDTNNVADTRRAVGGDPGVAVSYDPSSHLVLGGGGGAGEDDDGVGGAGGAGGGVVWIRADQLTGAGNIKANGAIGVSAGPAANPIYADGAGGGGAGGAVYLWLHGAATCGGISATGGIGGNATPTTPGRTYGPGGGGGGGIVRVAASAHACVATVTSGAAGTTSGASMYGATNGANGVTTDAAAGVATAGACGVASGACGGCVTDTMCGGATPTCLVSAGSGEWTCVALGGPGQTPAGGRTCVAGATPTQGTSSGCADGLCDTKDGKCDYASGTACTLDKTCRSGSCAMSVCTTVIADAGADASHDGGSTTTDAGGDSGSTTTDGGSVVTNDAGQKSDGGQSTNADSGSSSTDDTTDEGAAIEGGGCAQSPESPTGSLAAVGLLAMMTMAFRRVSRRKNKSE